MNRQEFRKIAIYLVIILVIIRFLVAPQVSALNDKKALYREVKETYQNKLKLLKQSDEEDLNSKLQFKKEWIYEKKISYIEIQTKLLHHILSIAEREGLSILNYELPEVTISKGSITDVPVIVRLRGKPQGINGLIIELMNMEKKFVFKQFETFKYDQDIGFTFNIIVFRAEK